MTECGATAVWVTSFLYDDGVTGFTLDESWSYGQCSPFERAAYPAQLFLSMLPVLSWQQADLLEYLRRRRAKPLFVSGRPAR